MNDFKRFLVSYRYEGSEWTLELPAKSHEDARRRVGQLALGRVDGEIVAKLPAGAGPLAALALWVRRIIAPGLR